MLHLDTPEIPVAKVQLFPTVLGPSTHFGPEISEMPIIPSSKIKANTNGPNYIKGKKFHTDVIKVGKRGRWQEPGQFPLRHASYDQHGDLGFRQEAEYPCAWAEEQREEGLLGVPLLTAQLTREAKGGANSTQRALASLAQLLQAISAEDRLPGKESVPLTQN